MELWAHGVGVASHTFGEQYHFTMFHLVRDGSSITLCGQFTNSKDWWRVRGEGAKLEIRKRYSWDKPEAHDTRDCQRCAKQQGQLD